MAQQLSAGVSLKPAYMAEALHVTAPGLFFEVHAENYMADGGPRLAALDAIAGRFPISLHGVGLSLAGDAPPGAAHLAAWRRLVDRFNPALVSEHLAWSAWNGAHVPDLLPFPRSRAALARVGDNLARFQDAVGRRVLVENPALYMPLAGHEFPETDFLAELVRLTDCGLLLDVSNLFVSARNLGYSAEAYLADFPLEAVGEIHLAGHAADSRLGETLLIDSHDAPVAELVWRLYERLVARMGARPTLIERDENLPPFAELMSERVRAERLLATPAAAALHV